MKPNILDIIIALPLVWGLYKGFRKGFIIEITTLAALVLGVFGAIRFSDFVAVYIREEWTLDDRYIPIASFAITFIGIVILINLLGKLVEKLVDMVALGFINKLAGSLFRAAKIMLILSVLFTMISSLDKDWGIIPPEITEQSVLYPTLSKLGPMIIPALTDNEWTKRLKEAIPEAENEINPASQP